MRWIVLFLLMANLVLFFWMQRQQAVMNERVALSPPDVGRLQLLNEAPPVAVAVSLNDDVSSAFTVGAADKPIAEIVDEPVVVATLSSAEATVVDPPVEAAEQTAYGGVRSPAGPSEPAVAQAQGPVTPSAPPPAAATADARLPVGQTDEVATPSAPDDPSPTAELQRTCHRVGPLADKEARVLLADLPRGTELLDDTVERQSKITGYYVLYPPLPSREKGIEKTLELRAAGYKDTLLLRKNHRNAISMGFFSRKETAGKHAKKIRQNGFAVEVVPKRQGELQRWLTLAETGAAEPALSLPRGANATLIDCP